ncbi:hypothetical protein IV203_023175 [Nitzschia inconspicua]|uniref:Uncharacterized protein n=1 Tax=Nitzschia inconspicua TaxID=303405 RepID=A0A9K3KCI4_9STRA|nr:hypothetical protein IV203_023175 [Nitzschia inconspicua]
MGYTAFKFCNRTNSTLVRMSLSMIHNVRAISERASLDLCGDETTWGHQGYGEKGSDRSRSKPANCARFSQPVTAVKVYEIDASNANDNKQYYTRVHVSMQSTSSTNFSTVNAMNENKKWIAKKDRGRATNKTKRVLRIEMNSARQLYLKTYGQIDAVDSMLRKCRICNKSFKYWHSSKNHALAMAVVFAYDMYPDCTTETHATSSFNLTAKQDRSYRKDH